MIILDYKIKFIFILYIYIYIYFMCKNTGQPGFDPTLKRLGKGHRLCNPFRKTCFFTQTHVTQTHMGRTRTRLTRPICQVLQLLVHFFFFLFIFFLMKMVVGNYLSIDLSLTKDNKLVWLLGELKFIDLFSLKINWVKI